MTQIKILSWHVLIIILTLQAIYWDEKTFFMEHEFIGPGGFVHAVALCRQRIIDTSVAAIAELLLQLHCSGTCRSPPEKMPSEVKITLSFLNDNMEKKVLYWVEWTKVDYSYYLGIFCKFIYCCILSSKYDILD